jgi:hypothetical protein
MAEYGREYGTQLTVHVESLVDVPPAYADFGSILGIACKREAAGGSEERGEKVRNALDTGGKVSVSA